MKSIISFLFPLMLIYFPLHTHAQEHCILPGKAFAAGEELRYNVVYNWGLVWLESAEARFSVKNASYNGKSCYYLRGEGSTYKNYDWFFKVRDLFETWTDSATMRPLKFSASIREGSKNDRHTYFFNDRKKQIYTIITRGRKQPAIDTVKQGTCTIDVLSAIYHARSFDYSRCKINDTISMSLVIDGKVYAIYVRYLGKDTLVTEKLGSYRCVKFSPLLVEGSIFKKGEGMTVWVSDDRNKLPLYIETPIIVGTIKVSLSGYKGLRYKEAARLN